MLPIADENTGERTVPVVTYILIAINVVVFILELLGGEQFVTTWAFVPSRFLADPVGQFITVFTSMFMHAGWLHLGGNMLYLWIFGDNVEDRFGHIKFLIFYLLCGIAATFSQMFFSFKSDIPNLGASGAIAGVLGAYLLMFPRTRVRVLLGMYVIPMSALVVIGFWFVLQLFSSILSVANAADVGGVAFFAHVGGFVAGFLLAFVFRGSSNRRLPA
jgi:membrane associated rhomboid family serine protease